MPNDLTRVGDTGFAPPFRALLWAPAAAGGLEPPTVPGYEMVAELGRGGMGVVYLARQCSLKRLVALKMILAGLHADATARRRFRAEAEAVARLSHPNIVQIHEVGECDGRLFLALEYVEGGSLQQQAAGTPQPQREAARLVETLARAVYSMHQHGVVHRDLKPANILLAPNTKFEIRNTKQIQNPNNANSKPGGADPKVSNLHGSNLGFVSYFEFEISNFTPKVSDFGLATRLDGTEGHTRTGEVLGTPHYMAPEQATGDTRKVGAPADLYALGAILYELLTGSPPFQGATPLATLEQVRTRELVPPRRRRRSLSVDLETICLKCLEKEPARRYPTALALADDLHRFLQGQPIQARPIPAYWRLWRCARRRPAAILWTLVAASVVCLLLTLGAYVRTVNQRAYHLAEERYQQFIRLRNDAFFYGLLAPDEAEPFLGSSAAPPTRLAEAAAREALALAGMELGSHQAETVADCYTLQLVLAQGGGQQSPDQEALRLPDRARQPGSALDHFLTGEQHFRRGRWREAVLSFDRALTLEPTHFWAQFFLAVCHLKLQHWEAAKAGLNACLAQQPDFIWPYLFRSFAQEKLQAPVEAEADFQRAFQLNPNPDARYVLYLTRGLHHSHRNEMRQAAADFRAARDLKPKQYHAYLNLAQVYLAQGQREQADEQFRAAIPLRPPAAVVAGYHVEHGRGLLRDQKYEAALQSCEQALKLTPRQPAPYEVRGRACLALGQYEAAEKAFDQYLRNGGDGGSDIFRGRGLARMKQGKYLDAVDDYTRALERAPDADIYQHRGWAHFFADAWKLALRDFAQAIELDPEAGDAYTGRGLARVLLGQYREAVADAEAALSRTPRTPEMMHNLACLFAQAAARAEADSQEPERQALAERYRGSAVQAIRRTLALVRPQERCAFWREKVLPDTALTPVRQHAEFQQLQAEYVHPR